MNCNLDKQITRMDFLKMGNFSRKNMSVSQEDMMALESVVKNKESFLQQLRAEISRKGKFIENDVLNPSAIMNAMFDLSNGFTGEIKVISDEEVKSFAMILVGLLNLSNNPDYADGVSNMIYYVDELMKFYTDIPEDIIVASDEIHKRINLHEKQVARLEKIKREISWF